MARNMQTYWQKVYKMKPHLKNICIKSTKNCIPSNSTFLFSQHVDHGVNSVLLQHEALNTADEVEGSKAVRHAKNVDIMVLVEVVTVVTDVF